MLNLNTAVPMRETAKSSGRDQLTNADQADLIAFAGPKMHFSDTLLRNIEVEIAGLRPARFDSITDFQQSVDHSPSTTCLLVVDADHCDLHLEQCKQFRETFLRNTNLAWAPGLAYFNANHARNLMVRLGNMEDVRGFLPMNQGIDIWLSVIRLMAHGGTYLPPELVLPKERDATPVEPVDLQQSDEKAVREDTDELTPREKDVIELVASGMQNKQVASELGISEHTIKLHVHHIIAKLGVRNRTEAATKYLSLNGN